MNNIKNIANSFAEEYCSDAIYPSHLFKAVLHKSMGLVHFIESELDKDYYYLQEWADVQMQLSPRAPRPQKDLDYSEEAIAVMEEADAYKENRLYLWDVAAGLSLMESAGGAYEFEFLGVEGKPLCISIQAAARKEFFTE